MTPAGRDLPTVQRPRRRRVPVGKILALTLVVAIGVGAVAVLSVPGMSKPVKSWFAGAGTGVITFTVKAGPLPISVEERGSLESSQNVDVYCNVEGGTTIIKIVPEGQRVKKGELLCELDSAALRDQLVNQRITTKSAEANFLNAKLTREVAEIAVKEYVEGVYVQDLATVEGDIKLAESELTRSEDRLEWARRMFEKGYVSKATLVTEELNFKKAQFTLEQAQQKKTVLVKYTRDKTIKELDSDVKKAHSDELAKQATWELEKGKEDKLEKQIANCTLLAPIDGLVVYANDPSRMWGSNQSQIEEGATVRERQKVISIPDISRMQVNAKVHEAQIDKITPNLKAQIRVDAFPDQQLGGAVSEVAPLPDAGNIFSSDIKVYTTRIRIENPIAGLRPGMTAQVKILVDRLENVLSVPVQAILQYNGKDHVTKKIGDRYDRIEVTIGASNDKFVQVTKGLADGDVVVLNPMSLMSEDEKREAFRNAKESKKDWGKGEGEPGKGGPPGAAGKGGPPGAAGKTKTKKGGRGGAGGAMFKKFQNLTPDERARMKSASPEEKAQLLKKAGFTEQEMDMMKNFGGGGGGGGFGGGGGRGRAGGGPPGGGDQ
jgi:HlyD family secretion protein